MPISYPLTFPAAPAPAQARLRKRNVVATSRSPYSLEAQTQRHQGQMWRADLTMPALLGVERNDWSGFLAALRGRYGSFLWGPPDRNAGSLLGTPTVDGAGQTGEALDTKGWAASESGVLKRGDLIGLGAGGSARLHEVLADVDSDALGLATIEIWPRLRASPGDGDGVSVSAAVGVWRLADDDAADLVLQPALLANVSLTIEEYL